ncbi:MotA/TolQ/ExbB proton channel family protein [Alkalimarinus alittae]|uniref:MotA/TolQ/ExbB proton channel family protein n=1 Tax=Alkalimarinus alittae TaxID=2961619 RepID=A0ABY6N4M9_9ALTE|nr:MotA/TolQ/ExbB proton channel family protein [Alkalimarinus alittae]UZE97073.1 MotA/TolQ/ExbB proton channel family protein [Alkalimarinus alittae]
MPLDLSYFFPSLTAFIYAGGPVLILLASVALILWSMLLERLWFRLRVFPKLKQACLTNPKRSQQLMQCCDLQLSINASLPVIKTLVALCPLIGLLGTVTGMIHLFDIMALKGTTNPRLMASGVAQATLPTMAGMVLAVSGLMFYTWLRRWSQLQLITLSLLRAQQ